MIGQTLGHYRILEKLGAGGMGEVYRARDARLDRDVACKVLPTGLLGDETARSRFRHEALALAKLNHPNIASVFDFDTQEGVDFLVMEYIAGVTLNDKIAAGPLPEKEILRLGAQVAEGLNAAHEQGVVHRDLKPGNLRITSDGRMKILDFGLAKLVKPTADQDTTASIAQTKAVVGTLPYMAPEQLRGEPVDARTDIYAFGAVLYEMATARRPFEHPVSTALAAEIQFKAPPPPSQCKPGLSTRLEEIILKCLEKEPENRYQSAKEIGVDLRRIASTSAVTAPAVRVEARPRRWLWPVVAAGVVVLAAAAFVALNVGGLRDRLFARSGGAEIKSLAVLPLENLSGDASQEYFADGMTEALIENLSKIRALRVISRTSVMQFKGTKMPLPEIARKLGVDAVIVGSVVRAGDRVRIRAQLVRAEPEANLWANNYDRETKDILDLHSEVAGAIVTEIRANLTKQEQAQLARARTVRPEVYEAYLRGRHREGSFGPEEWQRSIGFFQEALKLDPNYAPAYVGLARAYVTRGYMGNVASSELFGKAREAAARALELDDSQSEAHVAMGQVKAIADWDWRGAEREMRRALELDPSFAEGHEAYSLFLSAIGRHDEAIAEAKLALQLDPLTPMKTVNLGWRYQGAGRFEEAIEQYKKVLQVWPDMQLMRLNLAQVYVLQGRQKEATAEIEKVKPVLDAMPFLGIFAAQTYASVGLKENANKALEQANQLRKQGLYQSGTKLGLAYAYLGEKDRAIAELERAFLEHDVWLNFIKWEPKPDWLLADPRYQELLRKMNFPPESGK